MHQLLFSKIFALYQKQAPATGIGLFRLLFGLVTLQEVLFLIYFNHLIFDPIPFLDVEFPMLVFFLWLWALIAAALTVGYRCQSTAIANYIFWLIFVNFTPMQRDFDGGFDLFMTGANFFLIFMPIDRAFAIDSLRKKLASPFKHYREYTQDTVSSLAYYLPVIICLGFLYFDSAIHKLFAEHWRNGLGAWLPSSIPYYISALDMSWLLDQEILQKIIGYTIIVFQFSFLFCFHQRCLRPVFFLVGIGLHLGITLSFNIYPFGMGMLIFYSLIAPFSWYRAAGRFLQCKQPLLTVFYDGQCPLCCRTVLVFNHFDIFRGVDFKPAQLFAQQYPAFAKYDEQTLLSDLYAQDANGRIYAGVDTYAQILIAMRYTAFIGWMLRAPGIHALACTRYRKIADNRLRLSCDETCAIPNNIDTENSLYRKVFEPKTPAAARKSATKISKVLVLIVLLQLNSTIHYGLLYRWHVDTRQTALTSSLTSISNAVLLFSNSFLGITPHALYLHDHFAGYEHLLAITYLDSQGQEQWLPFVNEQGRLLAPNWGRVHSMWANIAVTPKINEFRLKKFIMKVTAFWGIKSGLDLNNTEFLVKLKKIRAPFIWENGLRNKNLSGDWQTIGSVRWHDDEVIIALPNDIDSL